MEFRDSPDVAAFRREVREFLAAHTPASLRGRPSRLLPDGAAGAEMRGWARTLAAKGWIAPAWPREYGGAGLGVLQQFVLNEEFARARVPHPGASIGVSLVGPTVILHGNDEQKAAHLPRILSGEAVWCQGFSEPGAGSDLASLQTRAVRDGDDYVINGQKIWTSGARHAHWMILLARTNPDAPKHRGISYLLVPMDAPGITVAPLEQMTGEAGFNQIFFEDVRVPARNRLGEEDRGWYIATTTLDFERSAVVLTVGAGQDVEDLTALAKAAGVLANGAPLRLELAERAIEARVALLLSERVISMQAAGTAPNHEASVVKLYSSELRQRIAATGIKVGGLYGQLAAGAAYPRSRGGWLAYTYLAAAPLTIAGGTSEIQRTIIATRGLGLPRE